MRRLLCFGTLGDMSQDLRHFLCQHNFRLKHRAPVMTCFSRKYTNEEPLDTDKEQKHMYSINAKLKAAQFGTLTISKSYTKLICDVSVLSGHATSQGKVYELPWFGIGLGGR